MPGNNELIPMEQIEPLIVEIRGQRVVIDRDLATLYATTTKKLNQAVRRNLERFPSDFMFQLSEAERNDLVKKFSHLNSLKHASTPPYAFTEHGVIMAAACSIHRGPWRPACSWSGSSSSCASCC